MLESLFNIVSGLQACNFIKKRLQHRCFLVNIANFLRTVFFVENLRWLLLVLCIFNLHVFLNPLSANPTKWANTLKQFAGKLPTNCLSMFDHFVGLALKRLRVRVIILQPFILKTWIILRHLRTFIFHEKVMFHSLNNPFFIFWTIPTTMKVLGSWWISAEHVEYIFKNILWIVNHLVIKLGQLIDLVMGSNFRKTFARIWTIGS